MASVTTRRAFLVAGGAGLVAAGGGWLHWRRGAGAAADVGVLARRVAASGQATAVGAAYLAAHPDEADPEWLSRDLAARLGPVPRPAERAGAVVTARVRRDFEDRDTASLDGWVLSRTELRLAALGHLLTERP